MSSHRPRGRQVPPLNATDFLRRLEALRAKDMHDSMAPIERENDAILRRILHLPQIKCHNCLMWHVAQRFDLAEDFSCTDEYDNTLTWSIAKAEREIAAAQLTPIQLTTEQVWAQLENHDLAIPHLDHIPATAMEQPGIVAWSGVHPHTGEAISVLINGSHRAARALRDRRPFFAYYLNEAQSQRSLMSPQELTALSAALARIARLGKNGRK